MEKKYKSKCGKLVEVLNRIPEIEVASIQDTNDTKQLVIDIISEQPIENVWLAMVFHQYGWEMNEVDKNREKNSTLTEFHRINSVEVGQNAYFQSDTIATHIHKLLIEDNL